LIEIKSINETKLNLLIDSITTMSFLNEKKLVIINLELEKKEEKNDKIIDSILNTIEKIPENNIVLFYLINPDKRSKLYKQLKQKCETKEFNVVENLDIIKILTKKYQNKISRESINKIIQYKS
jgi:DNA polymerase III delta subunit